MLTWYSYWPRLCDIIWCKFVNHNCHYWAQENPEGSVEKMQNHLWCGMIFTLVVTHLKKITMKVEKYLNTLKNNIWPINVWPIVLILDKLIFMKHNISLYFIFTAWAMYIHYSVIKFQDLGYIDFVYNNDLNEN